MYNIMKLLLKRFWLSKKESIVSVGDAVAHIENILRVYDMKDAWEQIQSKVVPYSIVFTLLGGYPQCSC